MQQMKLAQIESLAFLVQNYGETYENELGKSPTITQQIAEIFGIFLA